MSLDENSFIPNGFTEGGPEYPGTDPDYSMNGYINTEDGASPNGQYRAPEYSAGTGRSYNVVPDMGAAPAAAEIPTVDEEPLKKGKNSDEPKSLKGDSGQEPADEKKKKKKFPVWQIIVLILALAAAALVGVFLYIASTYEDRFIEGTYINGIYAGDKGVEEIEQEIRQRVEDYSIEVTFRGGAKETITGQSIGYEYVSSGGVAKLLEEQDPKEWLSGRFGAEKTFTVSEATKFDPEKLSAVLNALPEMQAGNYLAPTNAFLAIENNAFTIVPETQGNTLVYDELYTRVSQAAAGSALTVDIGADENAYEKPVVYADNADLISQRDSLNGFLQTVITYDLKDGTTKTIDGSTLINWISQDENGWYYIDDGNVMANVEAYVTELAAEVDNVKSGVDFQSSALGVIALPTATYGLQIGKDQEVAQLFTEIMERTTTERAPIYSMDYTISLSDLGIGNTYIEIDIPNQHLYYYKDGVLTLESDIVSGSEYTTPTPRGIFYIQNREQNVTLLGPYLADGKTRSYTTLVKYWLPFDIANGVGLHDASWRAEFGGDIYRGGGSHGCVNMPEAVVANLFYIVSVGTPVLVI